MPEFIPEHTPAGLSDFETGYFAAAEWTYSDTDSRGNYLEKIPRQCKGFSKEARKSASLVCEDFMSCNAADLELYCALLGGEMSCRYSPMEKAGHDFWLTRNRHGTGFWDRGTDPVFKRLADAAKAYGETTLYMGDNRRLYFF